MCALCLKVAWLMQFVKDERPETLAAEEEAAAAG